VPGDMLRMIEDASNNDPVQLQSGFNAYDECSSISTVKQIIISLHIYIFHFRRI
jgi:hypothetical protein